MALLAASWARAQSPRTVTASDSATLRQALTTYDNGNAAAAAPILAHLATRYPGDPQIQAAAGMSLVESGQLSAGVPFLQRAHTLRPADSVLTRNLAVSLIQLDQPRPAILLLEPLTRKAARDPDAWLPLAQAYRADNQLQRSADTYAHAATLLTAAAPEQLPNLFYDWAATLLAAGRPQAALEVLNRIPPSSLDALALALRAEANEKASHYEAALADYRQASELAPTEPNITAYGEELLRHWTFPAAASIFEYGLKQYPQSEHLQRDLGIAYYGNNDYLRASEVFAALLVRTPANDAAADLLGRSCSALGTQSAPACDQLTDFASAHPGNAAASLYAAIMLLQQPGSDANYTRAGQLLAHALDADPNLAPAWYQLGVLQQAKSDWAASAASLEKAVALQTEYPEAHYRLSRAYAHLNRPGQARQQMELQRTTAEAAKQLEAKRLKGVLTFLTEAR